MKKLLFIFGGILSICFIFLAIGLFLPQSEKIKESIIIKNTYPDEVYWMVNDFKNWDNWSPWHSMNPTQTKWSYSNPSKDVNAYASWESTNPDVGNGSIKIINNSLANFVDFEVYNGNSTTPNQYKISMDRVSDKTVIKTKVDFETEVSAGFNPIYRWMLYLNKKELQHQFQVGLTNLKDCFDALKYNFTP